ncbi:RusA family crossover junction endodeoxyribonuclease [Agrobacterium rhizogenes]|nr:RusA family crossover junction endodeoxyribonuclease [Rhizobium rhizogenes]NTF73979.1 RusA family crossover junction endodeoxyribonuclease [Rhizobium rhizogenes]
MMRFHLPYPPSAWDLYTGWGKTRRLSSEYMRWRIDAGWFLKPIPEKPISVPFSISIALLRQNSRQDLDNRSKAVLDCLQHYRIISNDSLCERLSMQWAQDLPAECVVIIQAAEEALAA